MSRLYALLAISATLLVLYAPQSSAKPHHSSSPAPPPYKVLRDFCRHRSTKKDAKFCLRTLKKDPRTATAKDLISLLKISVDLAVEKANKTHHFFTSLAKKGTPDHGLLTVLKECTSAYDTCVRELQIIPSELLDDIDLASYDALMAHDALDTCQASLQKGKIKNQGIVKRQKLSVDYVGLCVDIARAL